MPGLLAGAVWLRGCRGTGKNPLTARLLGRMGPNAPRLDARWHAQATSPAIDYKYEGR